MSGKTVGTISSIIIWTIAAIIAAEIQVAAGREAYIFGAAIVGAIFG